MNMILGGIRDGFREGMQLAWTVAFGLPAKFLQMLGGVIKAFVLQKDFNVERVETRIVLRRIQVIARQQHREGIATAAISAVRELERDCA